MITKPIKDELTICLSVPDVQVIELLFEQNLDRWTIFSNVLFIRGSFTKSENLNYLNTGSDTSTKPLGIQNILVEDELYAATGCFNRWKFG